MLSSVLTHGSFAKNVSINVYLKFKADDNAYALISQLNHFLAEKKLFSQYQLTPFLRHHPLHVTLYLADYQEHQIPFIIHRVKTIVATQKPLPLSTRDFITLPSGYTQLKVTNNPKLQQLSSHMVHSLHILRDKTATIPAWAAQNMRRKKLFSKYGSPGVFSFYNPHFSLFDPESLNKQQTGELVTKLKKLIAKFSKQHKTRVKAQAFAVGIGIADSQGQIIKELDSIVF